MMLKRNKIAFKELTSGQFAFLWHVAQNGYMLANAKTHTLCNHQIIHGRPVEAKSERALYYITVARSPWLVTQGIDDKGNHVENNYCPLAKTTLHREFSCLNNDESILGFANKYGLLGEPNVMLAPSADGRVTLGKSVELGESVELWDKEIRRMGGLMAVWDLVTNPYYASKLGRIISWTAGHAVIMDGWAQYDPTRSSWQVVERPINNWDGHHPLIRLEALIADEFHNAGLLERWHVGDVIEPAQFYIIREVNNQLENHVSPKALPPQDKEYPPEEIYLYPDSLQAALWTLFLMELMNRIRVRQCNFCSGWKEIEKARSSFYCSNACRQAAFRRRHSKKT
jgi:hypothetical protein